MVKLHYVLLRTFRTLVAQGFCSPGDERDGDGGGGPLQDNVDGTGMGTGQGNEDVSKEIEDEEQVLGLQGDEDGPPPDSQNKQDEGLEMEVWSAVWLQYGWLVVLTYMCVGCLPQQNDFSGELQDVPEGDKEEEDDDGDDNSDEEELQRQMGDLEDDNKDVVDEKLWNQESDEEDENDDKEEKFEKNKPVDGEDTGEVGRQPLPAAGSGG